MYCSAFDVVRFDLGPLLEGQTKLAKLGSANNFLIIGHRVLQVPTWRRGLGLETNPQKIMDWGSFDKVKFDLRPFLQGQMSAAKLKHAYTVLIIVLYMC